MNKHEPGVRIAERMLTAPEGATMDEIVAAAGGPQYNLLRRLAARGYDIRTVKEGRATRYFATRLGDPTVEAVITSKGQVTVPKEIRDRLRLRNGQKIRFTIEDDGRAVITPAYTRLADLAGFLPKPKRRVSIKEMNEAVRQAAVDRFRRALARD
jgi:antitoxin PrlF